MDTPDRPDWACLLHRPPTEADRPWARADPGYRTCSGCLDRLRERLREVGERYAALDPTPGVGGTTGRGAPCFGSRSPASDHVITLTDPRSSVVAKAWVAGDGRVHCEPLRPPVSVRGELDTLAWSIADERGIGGPDDRADVAALLRFIDAQLDWATRCELCSQVDSVARALLAHLRPVTGDPRPRYIGHCPNVVDFAPDLGYRPAYDEDAGVPIVCGARLYAPVRGDTIRCREPGCGGSWPRVEWLQLGLTLQASA